MALGKTSNPVWIETLSGRKEKGAVMREINS